MNGSLPAALWREMVRGTTPNTFASSLGFNSFLSIEFTLLGELLTFKSCIDLGPPGKPDLKANRRQLLYPTQTLPSGIRFHQS
jgi:hypothetical protein